MNLNLDSKEDLTEFFNNCNWLIRLKLAIWAKEQYTITAFEDEDENIKQRKIKSKIIDCFLALPYYQRENLLNQWLLQSI